MQSETFQFISEVVFFPILGSNELDRSLIMDSGDMLDTEFDFEDQVTAYSFCVGLSLVYTPPLSGHYFLAHTCLVTTIFPEKHRFNV